MLIAFIVFGGAVGATAYLAIEEIADSAAVLRMQPAALGPLPAHVSAPPAAESVTSDGAATDAELVEAPSTDSAPVVSESLQTTQPSEKPAARRAASENRIAKASARTSPPTHARSGESVAVSARPPAAAEASQPATIATASVAPESRATDRWELMSAALAACSRENFLAGVVCTERVRLQYCEGFWGQVPNCRAATRPSGSR